MRAVNVDCGNHLRDAAKKITIPIDWFHRTCSVIGAGRDRGRPGVVKSTGWTAAQEPELTSGTGGLARGMHLGETKAF